MNKKKFFLLLITTIFLYSIYYYNNFMNASIKEDKIIYIEKGYGINNVIKELLNNKIVKNKTLTKMIIRIKSKNKSIKYGEYLFKKNDKVRDILNKIINNKVHYRSITFAEGLSKHSILKIIKNNEYLTGDITLEIKEGELLPQTYYFLRGDTRDSLIKRMKEAMSKTLDKYWKMRDSNLPLKTKEEALILASIIEKETGIKSERSIISSVFINRLKINMPLQSDPTAIYAYTLGDINKEKDIKTYKLVRMKNDYNTYKIKKLPPTAICNPGEESIKAALRPARTKYLFFVAIGGGRHDFSETYKEHLNKINKIKKKI